MRWDICCHTNGDTCRTVYKKIWETRGENLWFFSGIVIVRQKIYGVFFYIGQHFCADFAHSCFCITISSRWVTVNRTEVSVTINEHISHREILCKTNKCVINGSITMWVVASENITDCCRTLFVWFIWSKIILKL